MGFAAAAAFFPPSPRRLLLLPQSSSNLLRASLRKLEEDQIIQWSCRQTVWRCSRHSKGAAPCGHFRSFHGKARQEPLPLLLEAAHRCGSRVVASWTIMSWSYATWTLASLDIHIWILGCFVFASQLFAPTITGQQARML